MNVNEFEVTDPEITMGTEVKTAEEIARQKEMELQLQLQSIEIERHRPENICILEAALAVI